MNKIALITGITGQDGSYLAELLLEKDYMVWGIIRRSSDINTQRIDHLYANKNLTLRYGDLTDSANLLHIFYEIKNSYPEMERLEVYNLAAMSHVKVSFEMPEYCGNVDAIGTLRMLEAIRSSGLSDKTRYYQASTSELYGKVQEVPQKETTPFYPRSPYGVAKLYGFWIVKNYRESYGMYACNGILFNHETLAGFMPLIFKQNNEIDIKPISEIVKYHTLNKGILVDENIKSYQQGFIEKDLEIWDNNDWTKVKYASGYPHDLENDNKKPKFIISKNSCYLTTGNHEIIMDDESEKKTSDIELGDKVKLVSYPLIEKYEKELNEPDFNLDSCQYCGHKNKKNYRLKKHIKNCYNKQKFLNKPVSLNEAELLGVMVGDGSVCKSTIRFTNKDKNNIDYVKNLWDNVCSENNIDGNSSIKRVESGFKKGNFNFQLQLTGFNDLFKKYNIYNEDKTKRVPKQILNSNSDIQLKFLEGYNLADGLKSNKCVYQFKNFKTNSSTLAQGLLFLINNTTKQEYNINVELMMKNNKRRIYYSINLLSNSRYSKTKTEDKIKQIQELKHLSQREISKQTQISRKFISSVLKGESHSNKDCKSIDNNTVKKIIKFYDYNGWFYDLETESSKFHAGIGQGRIHNSPRRGPTFVTRKVTRGLNMILKGERDRIVMGNLDARRDWGHAKDYVEGMWRILQNDVPEDFVLSTNEMHSVREFIEKSFSLKGFNIKWKGEGVDEIGYDENTGKELIFVSEKYFRPAEVEQLLGDSTKARTQLGWEPQYTFEKLVEEMVEQDCQ